MATLSTIAIAHGDGIGPEIIAVSRHTLQEAGASLAIEAIEICEKVYLRGDFAGIEPSSWEDLPLAGYTLAQGQ
jgi:isocitrate dehydrogenase